MIIKKEQLGKNKYTADNVLSYLEGNFKFYWNKLLGSPKHIQEQVNYRLFKCKDDCLIEETCIKCTCPPEKKAFVKESCNPERFGDLLSREEWEKFKRKNG